MKILKNPGYQPHSFNGLLTVSTKMLQFIQQVERISRTEASVLVRGQSGTGKKLGARYMHRCSSRGVGAFSAVNCAALTPDLMASELFGHRKGAFTGAISDRKGLLELTNGGTLFLDEIAEMPLDIQARLLRVLQDKCFTPLGSSELIKTNIRLISATHRSLRRKVEDGSFREDLMYRVRVIPIYLPTLAERGDDLPMLIWQFLDEFNQSGERSIHQIQEEAMDALLSYHWPGNIRELRNVIEYAYAIGSGSTLLFQDLNPDLKGEAPPDERDQPLEPGEKEQLLSLMQKHHGKRLEVAKALGVSRATLWRKLKMHGID